MALPVEVLKTEINHQRPYELWQPGEIDAVSFWAKMAEYNISFGHQVMMLPFGENHTVGRERRLLYFHQAVNENGTLRTEAVVKPIDGQPETKTRIISYGECNVACPYCKRDCQFIDEHGIPQDSVGVRIDDIARLAAGAVERSETVRFSGGDPVVYPKETLALASWIYETYGVKSSIAHNGSGPKWVEKMVPYLSSAAIDLKAVPEKLGKVMGIDPSLGMKRYQSSLQTQNLLTTNGVLLDVRTPVFGDTSKEEMVRLADDISFTNVSKHTFWTWRLYKEVQGCDWLEPNQEHVLSMMEEVSDQYPQLWLGMRAKWEQGGMVFYKRGKQVK